MFILYVLQNSFPLYIEPTKVIVAWIILRGHVYLSKRSVTCCISALLHSRDQGVHIQTPVVGLRQQRNFGYKKIGLNIDHKVKHTYK